MSFNKMGQTSSHSLKYLFNNVVSQTGNLSIGFNAALVLDGVRPIFYVKPTDFGETWDDLTSGDSITKQAVAAILLYSKSKLLSNLVLGQGYAISRAVKKNGFEGVSSWTMCGKSVGTQPPGTGKISTQSQTNEHFQFKGFIFYQGMSGIFFQESCPIPVSKGAVKSIYENFVHVYRVASKLSHLIHINLTHHIEFSDANLSNVGAASAPMSPQDITTLNHQLKGNGFNSLAAKLEATPSLVNNPAFRQQVIVPVYTFITSGMLDVLSIGPYATDKLNLEKDKWLDTLLSIYSQNNK